LSRDGPAQADDRNEQKAAEQVEGSGGEHKTGGGIFRMREAQQIALLERTITLAARSIKPAFPLVLGAPALALRRRLQEAGCGVEGRLLFAEIGSERSSAIIIMTSHST
jgi:hypothetical protein